MADYLMREETTVRKVYTLAFPTNGAQVQRMLDHAHRDYTVQHSREPTDDEIAVTGDDERLTASFLVRSGALH